MAQQQTPYERMMALVAYVVARPNGCKKGDVAKHVPGYQGLSESALEKGLQRDRDVLRDAWGIDIEYADRTWTYSIRPPFFTTKERTALITAAAMVDVDGIGDDELPGELGTAVSQARALIVVRVHGRVVELRAAIAQRQAVQFRFNGTVRTVNPLVVGMWRHYWYLVGDEHESGIRKKYNLDKIESDADTPAIELVGAPDAFVPPADLDPEAELHMDPNAWGSDPPVMAHVSVARDQEPRFLGEFTGEGEATGPDGTTVFLEVRDYDSFIIRILGFGVGVRLLGPPELVDRLRAWLVPQAQAI
ncbi:MAG: WYL domain-containing protein [Acidimicrobiia bacterium]